MHQIKVVQTNLRQYQIHTVTSVIVNRAIQHILYPLPFLNDYKLFKNAPVKFIHFLYVAQNPP